jgi:hypothetical protein
VIATSIMLAMLPANRAWGDALVVTKAMEASTIAEIFVEEEQVRVEFEVGAADIPAFLNILPDELYQRFTQGTQPLAERQEQFFQTEWVIQADGQTLRGTPERILVDKRIVRDEITGEPLAVQPTDADLVVHLTLGYKLDGHPQSLTIRPPRSDGNALANIGFVCYHDGVPVNDFRYLSAEVTLELDWEDPWYSRFRHRNLRRQYDAPLAVFLYVETFEVRKEIIVRPKDLQQWLDLGLEGKETIPIESQEALKQRVAEFLAERSPISVDGQLIQGALDRIHFIRRSLRTTGVVDPPEDLDVNTATLGVIFVYPVESLPQTASLAWDLFSPKIQQVPAAATDEAGGLPSILTPDGPELRWQNYLTSPTLPGMMTVEVPTRPTITVPVLSTLCFGLVLGLSWMAYRRSKSEHRIPRGIAFAGALVLLLGVITLPFARASVANPLEKNAALEPPEAKEVLHALLYNIYRAFDRRDESIVYDRLAQSTSGDMLTEVYLQMRRSMELENQGGAQVKVDDVEILDIAGQQQTNPVGLAYRCRWMATGSVGHWGHIHRRTNLYDAVLTIQPVDGIWKITNVQVRDERRIDPTSIK